MTTEERRLHRDVRQLRSAARAKANRWYFKTGPGQYGEGDRFLGLTLPQIRTLARTYRDLSLPAAVRLLKSPWHEERLLALVILTRQYAKGDDDARRRIYTLYLGHTKFVNNWDLVDCSAAQIVGAHLAGDGRTQLRRLAESSSVWERRIAVIATFHSIKRGAFDDALAIAGILVGDTHDLIHKAVGWMLREIGKRNRAAEERFLKKHAAAMPRTMLRYAVERFPERTRRRYLAMRAVAKATSGSPRILTPGRAIAA
ncbi:MAG: DNA alkylation repair protein, partial [Acidobacteriota bacterium]